MEQEKSNMGAIALAVIIIALIVGGGTYYFKNRISKEAIAIAPYNGAVGPSDPLLTYSTKGISVEDSTETVPFDYTVDQLVSMSKECGNNQTESYFSNLVSQFNGTTKTLYTFTYQGETQDSASFIVTLLPNKAGYSSLDQFGKDFAQCFAAGNAHPTMMNDDWLLFTSTCGSGFDDGSGRPHGCDEVRDVIYPTLKLKDVTPTAETPTTKQKSLEEYFATRDQFQNSEMVKDPDELGFKKLANVAVTCPDSLGTPCAGNLFILSKNSLTSGTQEFYLGFTMGTGYSYYGPFTDDLKRIVDESNAIKSLERSY